MSSYLILSKTTVLAGMLMPMAKVSVAKSSLTQPFWKSISTTSFRMGRIPEWWIPMPRFSSSVRIKTWGSLRSVPWIEQHKMSFILCHTSHVTSFINAPEWVSETKNEISSIKLQSRGDPNAGHHLNTELIRSLVSPLYNCKDQNLPGSVNPFLRYAGFKSYD